MLKKFIKIKKKKKKKKYSLNFIVDLKRGN